MVPGSVLSATPTSRTAVSLPAMTSFRKDVGAGTLPANFVSNDGDGRDANPSDPGDWVTTAEEGMYPSLCDDGNRWTAEQQLARQSYGGRRGRDGRQCDRYCRHRLEHANSSGARARQVRRLAIGHCRSDSLGGRTASAWSADQYDASAGDQPESRRAVRILPERNMQSAVDAAIAAGASWSPLPAMTAHSAFRRPRIAPV